MIMLIRDLLITLPQALLLIVTRLLLLTVMIRLVCLMTTLPVLVRLTMAVYRLVQIALLTIDMIDVNESNVLAELQSEN